MLLGCGESMLFCDRLPSTVWESLPREQKRRECSEILADFAFSFPSLTYRAILDTNLINAQAVTTAGRRYVNVYGGLVFYPGIGANSLVTVLLHETGHHFSGGRRSHINPTLACECEADHWAITEGARLLASRSGRVFELTVALQELNGLYSLSQMGLSLTSTRCWSSEWSVRKQALLNNFLPCGDCII